MTQEDIVVPICLKHTQQARCTLPWFVQNTEYHPLEATFEPLVNGEEAFRAVHEAIAAAKRSVDICCWGFQPSMYFIRDGKAPSIGELLRIKAKEGVRVRILGWAMPLNAAGLGGEGNLPGKAPVGLGDQALQSSSMEQYEYDKQWFWDCSVSDLYAISQGEKNLPVFVSRGFSTWERSRILLDVYLNAADRELSSLTRGAQAGAVTHHQKTVLVDYEQPESAIGFVMGHNMLDEYWDSDRHSARNRAGQSRPAPNRGPRGHQPRQDISSRVTGPILEHLHHNFAQSWLKETRENLFKGRGAKELATKLQFGPGTRQMAQLLRTQPQFGIRDIERMYMQAINNATQFIYIENQYFRWPPFAEKIKEIAAKHTEAGRDPGKHGALHLFVLTNADPKGIGPGIANTQRMVENLGRADTMPTPTKLKRQDAVWKSARTTDELEQGLEEIENSVIRAEEIPGLKVHICSLVAPDSWSHSAWVPTYIHSKLMIVDDVFTTLGSTNINTRSMQVDSEINIAHEWMSVTRSLRRRLWDLHTGGMGGQDDPEVAFVAWKEIIEENKKRQRKNMIPFAPLIEFFFDEASLDDLD